MVSWTKKLAFMLFFLKVFGKCLLKLASTVCLIPSFIFEKYIKLYTLIFPYFPLSNTNTIIFSLWMDVQLWLRVVEAHSFPSNNRISSIKNKPVVKFIIKSKFFFLVSVNCSKYCIIIGFRIIRDFLHVTLEIHM